LFARVANAGILFGIAETGLTDLNAWQAASSGDANSFEANPLFADLAAGDLHPRSAGGRYDPAISNFVVDAETSPLVDTADPLQPFAQESAPNGNRSNLGCTATRRMPAERRPRARSYAGLQPGRHRARHGNFALNPRGAAFTTAVYNVYVKISTNSGATTKRFRRNPALAGAYVWDTTAYPSAPTVRWQIQCVEQWRGPTSRNAILPSTIPASSTT
jgi:hypothetical protein